MQLDTLNPSRILTRIAFGSSIAIATLSMSFISTTPIASAQNQSDVTGPNMSDVTGPNLSDNTGSNMSDNTGTLVGGERIFADLDGNAATLAESLESFFERFGEDLGIESTADLRSKVDQAKAACNSQPNEGTRRFALSPRANTPQFNQACEEFNQLVKSIRDVLEQWRRDNMPANAVQRRLW